MYSKEEEERRLYQMVWTDHEAGTRVNKECLQDMPPCPYLDPWGESSRIHRGDEMEAVEGTSSLPRGVISKNTPLHFEERKTRGKGEMHGALWQTWSQV